MDVRLEDPRTSRRLKKGKLSRSPSRSWQKAKIQWAQLLPSRRKVSVRPRALLKASATQYRPEMREAMPSGDNAMMLQPPRRKMAENHVRRIPPKGIPRKSGKTFQLFFTNAARRQRQRTPQHLTELYSFPQRFRLGIYIRRLRGNDIRIELPLAA